LKRLGNVPKDTELICESFEAFLNNQQRKNNLNAVIIALPNHLHEPSVCLALESGLHVLCEKPVALSSESLISMLKAAESSRNILAVSHFRRHCPAAKAIKDIIKKQSFGACRKIEWLEGSPYIWPAESLSQLKKEHGGEELFDIGAHVFDLLGWWCGEIKVTDYDDDSRGGTGADFKVELKSNSGTEIKVRLSRIVELPQTVKLWMDKGTVTWHVKEFNSIKVSSSQFPMGEGNISFKPDCSSIVELFSEELRKFEAAINGNGSPTVSGNDAKKYVSIFDQCNHLRSKNNGTPTIEIKKENWPWSNRSIAVTGASGFIGCRLVEMALERGFDMRALVRRPQSCVRLMRSPVEPIICDILDINALKRNTENVSAIFHCAISWGNSLAMERSIIEGTRNVLDTAVKNGVKSVVILSSMLAHGNPPGNGIVDENSQFSSEDDVYGKSKRQMVEMINEYIRHHDVNVVVLEPTCVFGPFSTTFITLPVKQMLDGSFHYIENGRGKANIIYVDNLVDAMFTTAQDTRLYGKRYIINEEDTNITWKNFFDPICKTIGHLPYSIDRKTIESQILLSKKRKSAVTLFREAIRNYSPAGKYVSKHPLFKFYKRTQNILKRKSSITETIRSSHNDAADNAPYSQRKPNDAVLNSTVLKLYDTQAVYSSSAFRSESGWQPRIPFDMAMQHTLSWVRETWPGSMIKTESDD